MAQSSLNRDVDSALTRLDTLLDSDLNDLVSTTTLKNASSVIDQQVEHCTYNTKVMGSIPRYNAHSEKAYILNVLQIIV